MIKCPNKYYNGYKLEVSVNEYCIIVQALKEYLESVNETISFTEEFAKNHPNDKESFDSLSYFINKKEIIKSIIDDQEVLI